MHIYIYIINTTNINLNVNIQECMYICTYICGEEINWMTPSKQVPKVCWLACWLSAKNFWDLPSNEAF